MGTIFYWTGAVMSSCAAIALAVAALFLTVKGLIQVIRCMWVARLFEPHLKPYADNSVMRMCARISFGISCMWGGVPEEVRSVNGLCWHVDWLDKGKEGE